LTLRKLRRDDAAILALGGFLRQAVTATRLLADRAFEALSRPFPSTPGAFKDAFIEVLAVGRHTLRPLGTKINHGREDNHAQIALWFEHWEHSLDGIELSDVLFNC
jgi:hypothetical protein